MRQDVAVAVFDARHEERGAAHAFLREGRVGAYHLGNRDVAGAEAKCEGGVDVLILDAEVVQELDEESRAELVEHPSRDPVVTGGQAPLQRHHLSVARTAAVARRPGSAALNVISLLDIRCDVAGRPAVLHGQ